MNANQSPRYRAPALEKGLDILELMARTEGALTMSQMSIALDRSKGEIFRMLQVLEERGYIARTPGEDGYSLTNRLFMLGAERPPMRGLLEVSLPVMHGLAEASGQSCHLAVAAGDEIVIVARVEAPGAIGFAVRLGHRAPLAQSISGSVLLAWPASCGTTPASLAKLLEEVRAQGFSSRPSPSVRGVTDISAPVLQSGIALAALTVPFVEITEMPVTRARATELLVSAATSISEALRVGHDSSGLNLKPGMHG